MSPSGLHQEYNLIKDRDCRNINPVVQYQFEELAKSTAFALLTSATYPFTFQEAMNNQEKKKRICTKVEEMETL